jgi:Cu2+-exporting ATPase/Cu+-exporting ATPase
MVDGHELTFCCYGCRHIYEVVAPDLARGVDLPQAMGRAGLDLHAPCCRGIIRGDPVDEAANTLSRLLLNAFLAMMVMVLSLALYSDFFFADWGESGQSVRSILQAIAMLFATPAVLLLALPILEDAVFSFQVHRRLTTSALIAVGSLAAYGLSVYATFTGNGQTYFETAVMTLLLVTVGRWLDARTQVEGNRALNKLLARTPVEATQILPNGQEVRTLVEKLKIGDRVRVRPGENFAVDGNVIRGEGSVNEASITGESVPVYKGPGHTVYAGTTNLDGSFLLDTTHVGDDRVMGKLIRLLEEARLKRAPIEQLADRVAAYFTPIVIVLTAVTFFFWTWQAGFEQGLLIGLAVLLIACPCALGIATPLAIWTALGRAAQKGVLIRDSQTLEKLSHVRHVMFDKTGTLTTGVSRLVELVPSASCSAAHAPAKVTGSHDDSPTLSTAEDLALLQIAASLENESEHPLARSIQNAAVQQHLALLDVVEFRVLPGLGVSGVVAGRQVLLGSRRLVEQEGLVVSKFLGQERRRLEQAGLSVVHLGWHNRVQGLLGFAEEIRSSAAPALAEMERHGVSSLVLTGDSQAAGTALGQQLGVPVRSELLPQDKVRIVERSEKNSRIAMVGDGLNDAPALARAGVGIALGCGTDVTREAADISLLGNDLTQVTWTMALARRSYRTIGWNLIWAFGYNVVGIGLAMAGLLHPVIAAGAMVISSALVVGNSLRILRY